VKLVIDENIVQAKEAFSSFGETIFLNGREITNQVLLDADILIVRSITNVNEELLKNTKVKFVATATIGTDHIDENYLQKNNIQFSSASGCNSYSVAEYVFSAITYFSNKYNFDFSEKSIGVVGYGNIGTKVVKISKALGMKVIINDPPLERKTETNIFSTLEEALKCDIITFHVPLNVEGIDKTVHLLNDENIELLKEKAIIINSSRGPVISNEALKKRLKNKNDINTVLDVWETEPNFDSELFDLIEIGTPHIAGYSFEGKVNGTKLVYEALCTFLKVEKTWKPFLEKVVDSKIDVVEKETVEKVFQKLFNKSYNVMDDDSLMRPSLEMEESVKSKHFDSLRKNYKKRRELNNFEVELRNEDEKLEKTLEVLRVNKKQS
jgi:erythronate-4-phosphate dehydrogenase